MNKNRMPVKNQVSKPELDGWRDMPFGEAVPVNPPIRLERGEIYPFVGMASVRSDAWNAYGAVSSTSTSISTSMTQCVSCKPGWPLISTSTTMKDRIKVSTIARQLKSTSCSDQSRPHPSGRTLFFPFRGLVIGANHTRPSGYCLRLGCSRT